MWHDAGDSLAPRGRSRTSEPVASRAHLETTKVPSAERPSSKSGKQGYQAPEQGNLSGVVQYEGASSAHSKASIRLEQARGSFREVSNAAEGEGTPLQQREQLLQRQGNTGKLTTKRKPIMAVPADAEIPPPPGRDASQLAAAKPKEFAHDAPESG